MVARFGPCGGGDRRWQSVRFRTTKEANEISASAARTDIAKVTACAPDYSVAVIHN